VGLLECCTDMVVLQDGPVIVEHGEVGSDIDMEIIGSSRMIQIMDNSRKEEGKDFQIRENVLSRGRES